MGMECFFLSLRMQFDLSTEKLLSLNIVQNDMIIEYIKVSNIRRVNLPQRGNI
jgi:hypothetical protein